MSYDEERDDLSEIKERIYEEGLIEDVLDELECQNIKYVHNRYEAQLPMEFKSDSVRSVQVYDSESLSSSIRSRGIKGDIYAIIGYILYDCKTFEEVKDNLYHIKVWLCNLFEWEEYITSRYDTTFEEVVKRVDPLAFLRPVQKERKKIIKKEKLLEKENKILPDSVMTRYFNEAQWEFYKDGIMPHTQREFGVMYDRESERVVFPIHNSDGKIVGVKGRYIGDSEYILKEKKYMFLHRCDKSIELYNLYRALPYIKEKKEVIVVESEKSVMLLWQWGYKNAVALMGSEMSPIQAMLLKQLESDIVFAFDKDVEWDDIKKTAKQIKSRICRAIYDEDDLLDEKDAPVDKNLDTWAVLYSNNQKSIR